MSGSLKIIFKGHFLLGKKPVTSFSSNEEIFFSKILILGGLVYSQLPQKVSKKKERDAPLSPGDTSEPL